MRMSDIPEGLTTDSIVAFPVPCGRNAQHDNLKSINYVFEPLE